LISVPILSPPRFVLASSDPALLSAIEPLLLALGAQVQIELSLEGAIALLAVPNPPTLALIDATLPGLDPRMNIDRLLAAVSADNRANRPSIVLISDSATQNWIDRLAEGIVDDLILHTAESSYWRIRIEMVLRNRHKSRELETFREAAAMNAQMNQLTGVYNRESVLTMLFRETDRVQRVSSALSLVVLDIDDFGHWNSGLGNDACDDLLCQVAGRISRLLRSYDLLGRVSKDEFLIALPGCNAVSATMFSERIRAGVFSAPFRVGCEPVRLSACIGIASSRGRSPVVVLREAEQALQCARNAGPGTIECFGDCPQPEAAPVTFPSLTPGDELLAW
jgi:two-component system, cell cycle response regulator